MSQCKAGICCRQTPHPRNSSTNHWPRLRHRSRHRKTKFKAKRQNLSFSFSVFAPVCAFSVRVKPSRQSRVPTRRRQRFHKDFQISVRSALGWEETGSRKVGNVGFAKKQSFPNATAETSFKICVYAWARPGELWLTKTFQHLIWDTEAEWAGSALSRAVNTGGQQLPQAQEQGGHEG